MEQDIFYFIYLRDNNSVKKLLENCPSAVNSTGENYSSPLSQAIKTENYELTKYLLKKGADTEIYNASGETPLFLAFNKEDKIFIKLLLDYGADINHTNHIGYNILHTLVPKNSLEIVKLAIEYGIDINSGNGRNKITPLMRAAIYSNDSIIEYLLEQGADPFKFDDFGNDFLWYLPTENRRKYFRKYLENFSVNIKPAKRE